MDKAGLEDGQEDDQNARAALEDDQTGGAVLVDDQEAVHAGGAALVDIQA